MRAKPGICTTVGPVAVMVATMVAATVMLSPAPAAAVEYVKICDIYGAGFYYIPGTDTCLNVARNDARQSTEGGTWRWRVPNNPRVWAPTPQKACDGQLVKVGDLTGASLTLNAHERYETTTPYPLQLKPGQYITSVVYQGGFTSVSQGGFTGVGQGNFCLYYSYTDPDPSVGQVYVPLGCIDTASQATVPAALAFVPDAPVPPVTPNAISVVGANGDLWKVLSTDDIHGALSVWLCLQKVPRAAS